MEVLRRDELMMDDDDPLAFLNWPRCMPILSPLSVR